MGSGCFPCRAGPCPSQPELTLLRVYLCLAHSLSVVVCCTYLSPNHLRRITQQSLKLVTRGVFFYWVTLLAWFAFRPVVLFILVLILPSKWWQWWWWMVLLCDWCGPACLHQGSRPNPNTAQLALYQGRSRQGDSLSMWEVDMILLCYYYKQPTNGFNSIVSKNTKFYVADSLSN